MALRPTTLLAMILSTVTGVALGILGYDRWRDQLIDRNELARFESALFHVRQNYVEEVSDDQLMEGALHGMLANLDPHSGYLGQAAYQDLQAETSGHFGGIGLEVGLIDGFFTVVTPIDDTPAARAGLMAGDRLVKVDGETLRGQTLISVIGQLRGKPGTRVQVRYQAKRDQVFRDLTLKRETIAIASVSSRLLEPGYGYVRIAQFQATTGSDFQRALKSLSAGGKEPLQGLVLDLRNNPGGVLQASVAVADALLDDGLIVYTAGRLPSSRLKYRAAHRDALAGAPVVVLINGGSASASEIVAGALKDHERATLMGETTYGKGSVQSVVPLTDERAIKLTTAYYYTPNGRSIHKLGIEPHVAFADNGDANFDDALLTAALDELKTESATTAPLQAQR
ncbi:MAG: S41 family peptidase [Pseudomonadota bacterium]